MSKKQKTAKEKLEALRRQLTPVMVMSKVPVKRERAIIVIQPGSRQEGILLW